MAQETLVLKLGAAAQRALQARLEGQPFEHRSVPHARFSVRGEGVVATLYNSGKLVVQGADPSDFARRYVDSDATVSPVKRGKRGKSAKSGKAAEELVPPDRTVVGSDEAGKGDYFGPLVVCALRLTPEHREGVVRAGVTDSKALSDERVRQLAPTLEETFPCAVEMLDPVDYNRLHAHVKNLNPMLADLHAKAIRRVAGEGDVVLVDRFAKESLMEERLTDLSAELVQRTKAEREAAVAAASVVACARFLERLAELSEEFAVDLHKGAGAPTDRAARAFVRLHDFEALERVAKLHFRNTQKVPRG